MRPVPLEKLKNEIAREGLRAGLTPLLLRCWDNSDHDDDVVVEINVYDKKRSNSMQLPTDWLEQLKREYPKRDGDNGWIAVRTLVPRALSAGATWDRIMAGTKAYRVHCESTDKSGTAYVKQARTFYGPEQYFDEWADMLPVKTQKQIAEEARWVMLKDRAAACGFRQPSSVESEGAYETSLRFAEREYAAKLNKETARPVAEVINFLSKEKRA